MRSGSQFTGGSPVSIPLTPVVKALIIICLVIWFIFQIILDGFFNTQITDHLSLVPARVFYNFELWQPLTYMFLHSPQQVVHILFNLLSLWFIGAELEMRWGPRYFLGYYLGTGVGAAVLYSLGTLAYTVATESHVPLLVPVVGASGAIFGLMVAYAMLFGDRVIHFMFLFPLKAKYFVLLLGLVQFMSLLASAAHPSAGGGDVAYLAHIGGIISGYLIVKGTDFYHRWRAKRGHRKLKLVVNNDRNPKYWN